MSNGLFSGQLRNIFIEETDDGLELMEQGLLQLDAGTGDSDVVNSVFRAAHSIKGGGGTFGLTPMVQLTHHAESLLDQIRLGTRSWSSEIGSALLSAIDELRSMLETVRNGSDAPPQPSSELLARLESLTDAAFGAAPNSEPSPSPKVEVATEKQFHIDFSPHADLMATGNDPLLLLRELQRLGSVHVTCCDERLPPMELLDPRDCHLTWTVRLSTISTVEDVQEVFAWVEDECDLEIREEPAVDAAPPAPDAEAPVAETPATAPAAGAAPAPVQPPKDASAASNEPSRPKKTSGDPGSIRVGIEKVDALVDMVGELVITQSMLSQLSRESDASRLEALRAGVQQLERNTRELQEGVMRMRMLPIGVVFARLPRLVRDLGRQLGKDVELITTGETTELDKTVLEKISDPLVHLVRNSVDHGIEGADRRQTLGKPARGTVEITASHRGGAVLIEIRDDGGGIDVERLRAKAVERGLIAPSDELERAALLDLIFHPGLSTAEAVSDISGRGVGMDVVRRNIRELGGSIEVNSTPGEGTRLTIRLPLTLAILDGQLFRLGAQTYVLPLVSVIESLVPHTTRLSALGAGAEVYRLRDSFIPLLRLSKLYGLPGDARRLEDGLLIVTESPQGPVGLFVDELLGQQQVVIKSMETNFGRVDGVAGATILGNGSVALIADVPSLTRLHGVSPSRAPNGAQHCAA